MLDPQILKAFLLLLLGSIVGTSLLMLWKMWVEQKAKPRRTTLAGLQPGMCAVRGVVEAPPFEMRAPLTEQSCVLFRVEVNTRAADGTGGPSFDIQDGLGFTLRDETSSLPVGPDVRFETSRVVRQRRVDPPAPLRERLAAHKDFRGDLTEFEVQESSIAPGDAVEVVIDVRQVEPERVLEIVHVSQPPGRSDLQRDPRVWIAGSLATAGSVALYLLLS